MTRTQFHHMCKRDGVYLAALCAATLGVTLAVVQLWIRSL